MNFTTRFLLITGLVLTGHFFWRGAIASELEDELIPDTVEVSQEVMKINQEGLRDLASDRVQIDEKAEEQEIKKVKVDTDSVDFWRLGN